MKKLCNFKPFFLLFFGLGIALINISCENDVLDETPFENIDDELNLSVSEPVFELEEELINHKINFNWSTGTNQGTGAAIRYTLEIGMMGSDFSDPILTPVKEEKIKYTYSIDYGTLNNYLLDSGLQPGETYELQARLIADVADADVEDQMAEIDFSVTPYKPISTTLFIVGDATPNGWDISDAAQLTSSTEQRGVFIYEGPLNVGNFKFLVNRDECLCQDSYTKDPNNFSIIIYNEGGSADGIPWTITEEGNYRIMVDLLNETISIDSINGPIKEVPFPKLWILGDATESGWDINNPVSFTQNEEDPFIFSYEGNLKPGGFKIFAGPLGDFCGEWYRPFEDEQALVNGTVNQNDGCEVDYKWKVTEETRGRYKITLNTANNAITFEKVNLYIVGDGGPSGWDIADPQALTYENGYFVFQGELGALNPTGEFKFSKFTGNWCEGDWVNSATTGQSLSNTEFIITHGCEGPDNKWKLQDGDAGTYEIRINLDTETMSINKL